MHSIAGIPVPVAACAENECDSNLLPGGLSGTIPWPPVHHPSGPVVQVNDAPSVQLNFASCLSGHSFSEDDCTVFGANTTVVGNKFCVAESQTINESFAAGNNSFYPSITTTFSVFSRETTFVATRTHLSILSVTPSSPPSRAPALDIDSFRAALTWMLDFNVFNIPAPTSIALQYFSGQGELESPYWSPELKQSFHSLLPIPLWFFNPNDAGNIYNPG
ncbi:uncharacterized protein BDV17DRAFT_292991 [Aspergillus undulatus]|uniref:uncharacterized protein n=1 Tax=Aspergillus undulatus TaxID=1810928 RepID=UPI003CCDAD27